MTLTSRRANDSDTLSVAVSEWMHRVNRSQFGMAYTRRGMRLASYAVQELHANQGIHTHLLLGLPNGSHSAKANPSRLGFEELVIRTWCELDHGRDRKAQDVRPITDFYGAVRYLHKTVRGSDAVDCIDVRNLHIPNIA